MVNLDQAKKNVQNAQNQLDQALKELEKAKKKPDVWEQEFQSGCVVSGAHSPSQVTHSYPCKVTVRPLGGPEPFVYTTHIREMLFHRYVEVPGASFFTRLPVGQKVRVTVEEIE